jgi:hypothetical protein
MPGLANQLQLVETLTNLMDDDTGETAEKADD